MIAEIPPHYSFCQICPNSAKMDEDFDDNEWPFGSEGVYNQVVVTSGVGSAEVSKLLARADDEAGEYSFGGLADPLPAQPGLTVDGMGFVSTPLYAEQAEKLIALCEKSPFGHNFDTKMDENVRKNWQLQPNLLQFKNPLWQTGIEKLSKVIADRLGYRGIPLQCVLYKLLVYGEGGHFVKHQDTEKEDGMIATLVVQPPSMHEGGDLVVYRDGKIEYRHDFGKTDGTASYLPHYAVHYADAEHALEQVTKGYRLALVYSICLPPTMRHLERHHDKPLSEDLAKAISKMDGDDDSFGLLLDHEYTENSIRNLGSGTLKGVDSARFHALDGANSLVTEDKKLLFFIAQLKHDVSYMEDGNDCEKEGHNDEITWYTIAGEGLGTVSNFTEKLNFLNPGQETLYDMWGEFGEITKEGGFTGNEGSTRVSTYTRCAIVAWPKAKHPEMAIKFIPVEAAAEAQFYRTSVDGVAVRLLLEGAAARIEADNSVKEYDAKRDKLSMKFYRLVCELLVQARDPEVASHFFEHCCGALGDVEDNEILIPSITEIVRKMDWSKIDKGILNSLGIVNDDDDAYDTDGRYGSKTTGLSPLELTLRVVDGLESGTAQQALIKMATEKAVEMADKDLFTSNSIGLLWKWVINCGDKSLFDRVADKFTKTEPSLLGPSIQYLSQYLAGNRENEDKIAVLALSVSKRVQWLNDQIDALNKPFSWEMSEAEFPDNKTIQAFLRGPEVSMTTENAKKFKGYQEAQNYAATYMRKEQNHCSFEMEGSAINDKAFVTITKTRKWFLAQQKQLVQHQTELRLLTDQYGDDLKVDGGEKKRIRLDK